MFLQAEPAQTLGYMVAGYIVIFGVMGLYLLSLFLRHRNVQRDLETLEEPEEE